jgi:hypothetical protein
MTTPSSSGLSPETLAAAQRAREHWVQRALAGATPAPAQGAQVAATQSEGGAPQASAVPPQNA